MSEQCNAILNSFNDNHKFLLVLFQYRMEPDPLKKEERKQKLLKETIPFYLDKFEKVIVENGGYSVGGNVSFNAI